MKILFVCSGNRYSPNYIIANQAESIREEGCHVEYYLIKGRGITGYLKNILPLRSIIKSNNFNVIHAHYLFSCIIASISGAKPLVASFMGSDTESRKNVVLIRILMFLFHWDCCIVKTRNMKTRLKNKNIKIIPNGVNLDLFKPLDPLMCMEKIGWDPAKVHVLFPSDPMRPEKNFILAEKSIRHLGNSNVELHTLFSIQNKEVPFHLNACKVVLLTSKWEGSPNVIKEAMACNCRIVSTNVGDVKWLINNTKGCYLADAVPDDIAAKVKIAIDLEEVANGRDRLMTLGLDSQTVATRLINLYKRVSKR